MKKEKNMTKRVLMLLMAAAGAAGCTPTYRVHVNTFSQFKEPLNPGASINVAVDPNSRNPILAEKMASKTATMLQDLGYSAAEKTEAAPYTLTFRAGVDISDYLDYIPISRPFGGYYGFHGGFHRGYGFGYTTYAPYVETVYTHWLEMRLYGPGGAAKGKTPLWIGEAVVGMEDPEMREAVNYLLVGLMEYFGTDTGRWVSVAIKKDDPRVLALAEIP
jgi:hypothetical protein